MIGPDRKVWGIVGRDVARQMVADGNATWWNGSRDVKLIAPELRGRSCMPGPGITERYVAATCSGRDRHALEIVEGWQ